MAAVLDLFLSNDKVLVWNATDAGILRDELRIVGNLVGCLPRFPRQNVYLGLPLQLMPEEVTLLLKKGLARLVENCQDVEKPTEEQRAAYEAYCDESYRTQVDLLREERKKEMLQNLPKIIKGKKGKKKKELEGKNEEWDEAKFEQEIADEVENTIIPTASHKHTLVQLFTESPWQSSAESEAEWNYPQSEMDRIRCRIYEDLWERGNFLTTGTKFGGDFLVYPGDPARFHSHYIAICVPHKKNMTALDLVAMGRLGSNVRKTVVICSVDEQDKVCYTSLQWTGIS